LVETHKIDIEEILQENREEREAGRVVVYMIDQCHLLSIIYELFAPNALLAKPCRIYLASRQIYSQKIWASL
jgi:hypothetical protein